MGMPKVSTEVIQSTSASMAHGRKKFWEDVTDNMHIENPLIYQILTINEASSRSAEFKEGYKRGACLIYAVLSRQAEADDMNEIWGLGTELDLEKKEVIKCSCGSVNWEQGFKCPVDPANDKFNCKDCGLIFKRYDSTNKGEKDA